MQHVLTTLEKDYWALMVAYRVDWRSEADRAEARETPAASVATARQTVAGLQETRDPELRRLMSQLTIQSELADDSLKDPSLLRR
jgi:hypothetical protein